MRIDTLYHWAPHERRDEIAREGIKPFSVSSDDERISFGCICLGTSPAGAWGLSGGAGWAEAVDGEWDLWQVRLGDEHEIEIRTDLDNGPVVKEVRVTKPIPPGRIWWIATRADQFAPLPVVKPKPRRRTAKK